MPLLFGMSVVHLNVEENRAVVLQPQFSIENLIQRVVEYFFRFKI